MMQKINPKDPEFKVALATVLQMAGNDLSYGDRPSQEGDKEAFELVKEYLQQVHNA